MAWYDGFADAFVNPFEQTLSSFAQVFTDPAHANFGDFASVILPGIGGTIVSDVKHPTDALYQGAILAGAAGGAALAAPAAPVGLAPGAGVLAPEAPLWAAPSALPPGGGVLAYTGPSAGTAFTDTLLANGTSSGASTFGAVLSKAGSFASGLGDTALKVAAPLLSYAQIMASRVKQAFAPASAPAGGGALTSSGPSIGLSLPGLGGPSQGAAPIQAGFAWLPAILLVGAGVGLYMASRKKR